MPTTTLILILLAALCYAAGSIAYTYFQRKWSLFKYKPLPDVADKFQTREVDDIKSLRLDVAMSGETIVNQPFDVAVIISPTEISTLFDDGFFPKTSNNFQVTWPQRLFAIDLTVQVTAPNCTIYGEKRYKFKMYHTSNPPIFYFQLTPETEGNTSLVVTVFQKDIWLGSARIGMKITPNERGKQKETFITSQALSMKNSSRLHRNLALLFGLEELKTLCFDLGMDYENFPALKDSFTRELVIYCKRNGRLNELIEQCKKLRPLNEWAMTYNDVLPT